MINAISNLPTPMKAGGGAVATGGALGAAYIWFHDLTFILIIVGGILLLVLLYLAWKYYSRLGKSRNLKRILSGAQTGAADTDDGTNVQAIRDEFYEGLKTFLTRAKNPESKPWYLVVGESSSGKTQAIINSQLRFIMKSAVGGLGGTMGMKWWFTQEAVILDTAGRLMLPPEQNQSSLAWREFLEILKKERSNCPINGLFLMISAQSLLEYSSEKINEVAGIIASRFEEVQDELGVRFPVYVFITKCDLINGFNEFFEDLSDPRLQNQMLGWSNPANLDEDFDPKLVDEHLEDIRQRMLRRRAKLLLNPPPSADPAAKRLDQVDALFNLPDSITKIGSRLRLYLETIFAGGADEKHLFLRGIYFTCAMQRGAPIDADLAAALGVPLSQLPKERVMNRMRSFFLRDVFVEKAFRERGLVTRAHNVSADKVRKRALILGSSIGMVCLLIGITALNAYQLSESLKPFSFFEPLVSEQVIPYKTAAIIAENENKQLVYNQAKTIETSHKTYSVTELLEQTQQLASQPISAPLMLKPVGLISSVVSGSSLPGSVRAAHTLLFESLVLQPLLKAVRDKMSRMTPADWDAKENGAYDALVQLIALEKKPGADGPAVNFEKLLKFFVGAEAYDKNRVSVDATKLMRIFQWTYSSPTGGKPAWPPACLSVGTDTSIDPIRKGVASYVEACKRHLATSNTHADDVLKLATDLQGLKKAEDSLPAGVSATATTNAEYDSKSGDWITAAGKVIGYEKPIADDLKKLKDDGLTFDLDSIDRLYIATAHEGLQGTKGDFEKLLAEIPDATDPMLKLIAELKNDIRNVDEEMAKVDTSDKAKKVAAVKDLLVSSSDSDSNAPRRYLVQCQAVDYVLKMFPTPATASGTTDNESAAAPAVILSKAVNDLKLSSRESISHLESTQKSDPDDKQIISVVAACKDAVTGLIGPKRRTVLVTDTNQKFPDKNDGWQLASMGSEAKAKTLPKCPHVPMTQMEGEFVYKSEFSPKFIETTSKDFESVDALFKDPVLDAEELANVVKQKRTAWLKYLADYRKYWTTDVLLGLDVTSGDWKAMRTQLEHLNMNTANDALDKLGKDMFDALSLLDDKQESLSVAEDRQRLASSVFKTRCQDYLHSWSDLSEDPVKARYSLINSPNAARTFRESYIYAETEKSDYIDRYWHNLTVAAAGSLAVSANKSVGVNVEMLSAAKHFPLDRPVTDVPDLDPKKVEEARSIIQKLAATGMGGGGATVTSADDAPFAKIRNLNALVNHVQWLNSTAPLLDFLPKPDRQLHFSVVLLRSSGAIYSDCLHLEISQGGVHPDTVSIRQENSKFPKQLTLPGGPILIEATDQFAVDNKIRKSWKFGKEQSEKQGADYSLLRLMLESDSIHAVPDKTNVWNLTLNGKVNIGGKEEAGKVELQLTLEDRENCNKPDAVLPIGDSWPKSDADK